MRISDWSSDVCSSDLVPGLARAQALEKKEVTIAVGGQALIYYLPLSIANLNGYFKDEGLNAKVIDFAGGSKALQAVVGGSADVVSGAFEHTINLQRSEEHTSELQSLMRISYAVFCLKKTKKKMSNYHKRTKIHYVKLKYNQH